MLSTSVPGNVSQSKEPIVGIRVWTLLRQGGSANGLVRNATFVLGGLAVLATGLVHLHLWMTGYNVITTIGPLFLIQSIAGFVLAAAVIVFRQLWCGLLGCGYLVATIAGFLISVNYGLFGFQDTWAANYAGMAFTIEVIGAVLLLAAAVSLLPWWRPSRPAR